MSDDNTPHKTVPTSWPRQEGPPRCQAVGTPYEVQCLLKAGHLDGPHQGAVVDSQGLGHLYWGTIAEVAADAAKFHAEHPS